MEKVREIAWRAYLAKLIDSETLHYCYWLADNGGIK